MAIDPRIAMGFQMPEMPSQLGMAANALQLKNALRQGQMADMEMQQRQAEMERSGQLRNFLAQTDINTPEGMAAFSRQFPLEAPKIQAQMLEPKLKQATLDKDTAQAGKYKTDAAAAEFRLKQDKIAQNLQMLASVQSPEQAAQWVSNGVTQGLLSMEQAQAEIAKIPRDAQGFAQWRQSQQAAGMSLAQQMDQMWKAKDFGQKQEEFKYRQTNDAANRSVTIRGQNMADARAREGNATQRDLLNQQRQLQVDELKDKAAAKERAKDASAASIINQVSTIDLALNHPGRETGTGFSGLADPRNYIPGTDARNFRAVADQISGAAFLQAFDSLKGGGAITEIEGKKAEAAIARLDRAQSDAEYVNALTELRGIMGDAYKRQTGQELPKPKAPQKGGASGGWDNGGVKFLGFE